MVVQVRKYSAACLEDCVSLLADAFVTNPLHRCAFGIERIDQNRLFFRIGLRHMFNGHAAVALSEGALCGYVHFNESPYCLPAPEEIPNAAATLLHPLGEAIPRVIQWFSRWCRIDPEEPHIHLGPIGVAPAAQRRGVGTQLMNHYVAHLNGKKAAGYLETDKAENVDFYSKFGFIVLRQETLIGTPTWYMWRPAEQ
jgi:ribosomal protein S18 acetylase RimI-like enzyme